MACFQADLTISKGLFERKPSNASDGNATRVFRRLLKESVQIVQWLWRVWANVSKKAACEGLCHTAFRKR